MLVLSRLKNESIIIGGTNGQPLVKVTIVEVRGEKVRLGIEAPKEVAVDREEVRISKDASIKAKEES